MDKSRVYVAGIDLGTTNSCISVFRNNRVVVVPNETGTRTSPSFVSFGSNGRQIGCAAKSNSRKLAKSTIYEVKRLIGHPFNSPAVKADMKKWPFVVQADEKGRPVFEVSFMGEVKRLTPEQVSAMIIEYLVNLASEFIQHPIKDIVITVPAYFNDNQRQATKDAGIIAGFNVLHVLNEPTAAAIAYGFDNVDAQKNILVYDLGGGTFDVTILNVESSDFTVLASDGDSHLGGSDFDGCIMKMIIKELKDEDNDLNPEKDPKLLLKIKLAAEQAKISLSFTEVTEVEIDDHEITITRQRFVSSCKDLFDRTLSIIDSVLQRANITREDIDEVVMVGGSSHIPYIHELLSNAFSPQKICEKINPDEAVSQGATLKAVQLALLQQQQQQQQQPPPQGSKERLESSSSSLSPSDPLHTHSPTNVQDSQQPSSNCNTNSSHSSGVNPESHTSSMSTSTSAVPTINLMADGVTGSLVGEQQAIDEGEMYDSNDIANIRITDVVPLTLGIKTSLGNMSSIICRDTPIPCTIQRNYVTSKDNQNRMKIRIYQGDHENAEENFHIGNLVVQNIPPKPKGECSVDITMSVNENGILTVTALEMEGKQTYSVTFNRDETNLTNDEVNEMRNEAQRMKEYDSQQLAKLKVLNDLQTQSYNLEQIYREKEEKMTDELKSYYSQSFRLALDDVLVHRLDNRGEDLISWNSACVSLYGEMNAL